MTRFAIITLAQALFLFSATPCLAEYAEVDEFGPISNDATFQSPQDLAVELRIGPYLPNVDDEFNNDTPFADHFGNETRWHVGFEVDWQLLRIPYFGSVGPGFGLGLTNMTGKGFTDENDAAEQTTTLSVLPMHAVGVVRIDTIALNTAVPIVPYGKFGLGYALWWTDDGQGLERAAADGRAGEDTSYGPVWALGGMLLLDAFDRVSASDLDATSGVNHSYVFLEWFNSDLDGFDSGKLQVGVNTWMMGIALEI